MQALISQHGPQEDQATTTRGAQLLKQVLPLILQDRQFEHPTDQQTAIRQCFGRTLVSVSVE